MNVFNNHRPGMEIITGAESVKLMSELTEVSSIIQMRVLEVMVLITQLSGDHLKVSHMFMMMIVTMTLPGGGEDRVPDPAGLAAPDPGLPGAAEHHRAADPAGHHLTRPQVPGDHRGDGDHGDDAQGLPQPALRRRHHAR